MRVAAGQVDITPQPGVELSGYLARVQPSVGAGDPLAARCLWLEDGPDRLLWVHADLIGFEGPFVRDFREWARERLGLAPDQVVLSATHTHSGPATVHLDGCGEFEAEYVEWLSARLRAAAEGASRNVVDAEPVFAEGTCELNVDRRGGPSAHTDPRVAVLAWRNDRGEYTAVLANYPMHNVALTHENRRVSGDIAGAAARQLAEALPGRPTVLLTNGACGNLNPSRRAADLDKIEPVARGLTQSILDALGAAEPLPDARLRTAHRTVNLPLRPLDRDGIREIAEGFRAGLEGKSGYCPDRQRGVIDTWERTTLERLERGGLPRHVALDLQWIRLGDISLVCMNAEVFSRMADDLRAAAGERVYVVGYANGLIGYLPTPEAFQEGGYETDSALLYYRGLPLDPAAFALARDQAIEMLRSVE